MDSPTTFALYGIGAAAAAALFVKLKARLELSRAKHRSLAGHETIIPAGRRPGMARWREALFGFMHRNAQRPGAYFNIPHDKIMEIGVEFEI